MLAQQQIKEIAQEILNQENLQLVDLSVHAQAEAYQIRLVIDKEGGVPLEACARINKRLAKSLMEQNTFAENYTIEVSSPGLDRELKSEDDYKRCVGKLVKIITKIPIAQQYVLSGRLKGIERREILLETGAEEDLRLNLDNIKKAKLEIRWK